MKKLYTMPKKILIAMFVIFIFMGLLLIRLAYLQFIKGSSLKEQMYNQLITSRTISPSRGTIYDSTGKALAISAKVDTISIIPTSIVVKENGVIEKDKTQTLKEKVAKAFSDIFKLDYEETLSKVSSDSSYITIVRKVEKDKVDKLKAWMEKEKVYSGINIDEDAKRYYPYNNLASSLMGFCNIDNQGIEGLELEQ
mgnify:FL=1